MAKKYIKIYIYPLVVLACFLIPWYLLIKFVLNLNIDQLLSFVSIETGVMKPKTQFTLIPMVIYVGWAFFNSWEEKDPGKKLIDFFLSYGESFALVISIQFFVFIICLSIIFYCF